MQLFLMPPVVQNTRGIHEIGLRTACVKTYQAVPPYHDIHTHREIVYRGHYDKARYARPNNMVSLNISQSYVTFTGINIVSNNGRSI